MRFKRQSTDQERKRDLGSRREAIERELAEAEAAEDRLAQAVALNNLGAAWGDEDNWEQSLAVFQQAAERVPDDASVEDRATPHGNAAQAARRLERWDVSLLHALWVDALAQEGDDDLHRAIGAAQVGLVRRAVGDEFEQLLDQAIAALPEERRGQVRRDEHLNPTHVDEQRLGRNDPCHCGSGKKYKHCHLREDQAQARATTV